MATSLRLEAGELVKRLGQLFRGIAAVRVILIASPCQRSQGVYACPADSVLSGVNPMPIRRADRLFDILRILRAAARPVTAAAIADELEVTARTVYRDIATLQSRRIPIAGAAGIGYVLRRGFDLPPLMFTEDEAEAIAVAVRLLARTGDPGLQKAAESVLSKVTLVVPDPLRDYLNATPIYVSKNGAPVPA